MSRLYVDGQAQLLFTENETNAPRLWNIGGPGYFKDGFHERIVGGRTEAVNPAHTGTKAGVWLEATVPSGGKEVHRLRLTRRARRPPVRGLRGLPRRAA